METDYNSEGGSAAGGPQVPLLLGTGGGGGGVPVAGGHGLRPTTAAAIGGGLDADLMGDDLDNDYDDDRMRSSGRPNTAGAIGYRGAAQQAQPSAWGYSRGADGMQQQAQSGGVGIASGKPVGGPHQTEMFGAQGGGDPQNRRPHTAHGARGNAFPNAAPSGIANAVSNGVGYAGSGEGSVGKLEEVSGIGNNIISFWLLWVLCSLFAPVYFLSVDFILVTDCAVDDYYVLYKLGGRCGRGRCKRHDAVSKKSCLYDRRSAHRSTGSSPTADATTTRRRLWIEGILGRPAAAATTTVVWK
jgi:hypothetical protein